MSVQKHTPGPWKVARTEAVKGDWSCYDDGAVTSTTQPISNSAGNVLAFVADSTQGYKERASFNADALLIAAAPDLLEFACLVLRGLKSGNVKAMPVINLDDDAEQLDMRSLADIASEVIAKAGVV